MGFLNGSSMISLILCNKKQNKWGGDHSEVGSFSGAKDKAMISMKLNFVL